MIGERYKLYLLAFAIYTGATIVLAMLELLAIRYNESTVLARLITMLSGGFLGGFALVLGILKDNRVEQALKRVADAAAETARVQEQSNEARKQAALSQQQAEQERQRADRAEAELQRLRHEQQFEARFRRLEEAFGLAPPSDVENDDSTAN